MNIAQYIDHTILKPTTTLEDIRKICAEAIEYNFAAVCDQHCSRAGPLRGRDDLSRDHAGWVSFHIGRLFCFGPHPEPVDRCCHQLRARADVVSFESPFSGAPGGTKLGG